MRKLLLIATLALSTAVFAQTSGVNQNLNPNPDQNLNANPQQSESFNAPQKGQVLPYEQQLAPHIDHWISLNQTVSPFRNQYLAIQNINPLTESPSAMAENQAPGSMAAGEGQAGAGYWYNQMVQSEAQFNARQLDALRNASGFKGRFHAETE